MQGLRGAIALVVMIERDRQREPSCAIPCAVVEAVERRDERIVHVLCCGGRPVGQGAADQGREHGLARKQARTHRHEQPHVRFLACEQTPLLPILDPVLNRG